MFIGISLYNLFNLLFHLFMVRSLPPVDYGHLNTLMALSMFISVPANTIQTTVTKFVSSFQIRQRVVNIVAVSLFGINLFLAYFSRRKGAKG